MVSSNFTAGWIQSNWNAYRKTCLRALRNLPCVTTSGLAEDYFQDWVLHAISGDVLRSDVKLPNAVRFCRTHTLMRLAREARDAIGHSYGLRTVRGREKEFVLPLSRYQVAYEGEPGSDDLLIEVVDPDTLLDQLEARSLWGFATTVVGPERLPTLARMVEGYTVRENTSWREVKKIQADLIKKGVRPLPALEARAM